MALSKKDKKRAEEGAKDWERIDKAVFGSEDFLERHSKQIIIAILVIVVVVGGFFAYKQFILTPKNELAQNSLFKGQEYYEQGQDSLALFGDGNGYIGFKKIMNEYSSTPTGDLAKAYTGLAYSHLGKYDLALTYLKDYKVDDKEFKYLVKGAIGDCLVNTGKTADAIPYFIDAAEGLDNGAFSGAYYLKAGLAYRAEKNYTKEIEIFTIIKNKYMNAPEATVAQKYILEAQALNTGK